MIKHFKMIMDFNRKFEIGKGHNWLGVTSNGVVAQVLNCDIVVSEFKLQSNYIVYIRTSPLRKN